MIDKIDEKIFFLNKILKSDANLDIRKDVNRYIKQLNIFKKSILKNKKIEKDKLSIFLNAIEELEKTDILNEISPA